MQFVFISLALLGLVSACPMHGQPDHNRAEQNIPVANLRKRNYIRPAPRKIAITNVHVFDGFKYGENTSTVVIDGSFIGTDSMNATVVDGQGGTLMPGLIDNHNHPLDIADLRNLTNWGITTTICTSCWAASDLCQSLRNQPGLTGESHLWAYRGENRICVDNFHVQISIALVTLLLFLTAAIPS